MGNSEKRKKKRKHRSPSLSTTTEESSDETPKKKLKKHKRDRRESSIRKETVRAQSSDSSAESLTSSFSSDSSSNKRKHKKRKLKHKKGKHKTKTQKKEKKKKKLKKKEKKKLTELCASHLDPSAKIRPALKTDTGCSSSVSADKVGIKQVLKPLTKEEWEKQQSTLHRMYDPETGRNRLIRGDGEIVEEIVSRDRHREINKQATAGDGLFYQIQAGLHK